MCRFVGSASKRELSFTNLKSTLKFWIRQMRKHKVNSLILLSDPPLFLFILFLFLLLLSGLGFRTFNPDIHYKELH